MKTHFRKMKPEQLTVQWLETDSKAFLEPILIDHAEGLDMKVLPADIKISEIAELVGRDKPLDVIGKLSQEDMDKQCQLSESVNLRRRRVSIRPP